MLGALAISGIAAGSAQAIESEWLIEGETLAGLGLKEEKLSITGGAFTLSVPSKEITIKCSKVEGTGKILEKGADEISASLTGCEVAKFATCKVVEPIKVEGKSVSILTGGNYYRKLESLKEGVALTTVSFKEGTECALPLKNEVTGSVAAGISGEELVKQPLTFSESLSTKVNKSLAGESLAELKLSYGAAKAQAIASGELILALAGAKAGKVWQDANMTHICDTAPNANNGCTGVAYPTETDIKTEQLAALKLKFGKVVTCTSSKWEGKTKANNGAPLPGKFTVFAFTGCTEPGGNCTVDTGTGTAPYNFFFETLVGGVGRIAVKQVKFKIICGALTCEFGTMATLPFLIGPGMGATFSPGGVYILPRTGGPAADCGANMEWEKSGGGAVGYKFLAPTKIWITA
jgi:hypothetical protein